ncbi:MAG TPA: nuclear transport factor 2 family protein [Hanamia sp.]|nr:nuclear transport factor 2 family protein [Hanamia sp.]
MLLHPPAKFLLSFAFAIVLFSCNSNEKKAVIEPPSTKEMLKADMDFSDMCRQVGMKKAFLQYIDDEGTLLRPDHFPIVGAEAIDYISSLSDTSYKLSWRPAHAEIAFSGDLGYTYGTFTLQLPDTTLTGTYVNIWKKENDGEWKFVLNSDNPGTEQQ